MKKIWLFASFVITLFVTCSEKKDNITKIRTDKKKIIDSIVSKYKIGYDLDSLGVKFLDSYSISYRAMLGSKYQLIDDFTISDIYETDSIEYVSIKSGFYPAFYLDFPISRDQERILLEEDNDLIFVVSITELKKIKLSVQTEVESENTTVVLDNSSDFIGKGNLIDIISIKKQPKD